MSNPYFIVWNSDESGVDYGIITAENWFPDWAEPQEFAISDDGRVLLLDTTGHYYDAPPGRFVVDWVTKANRRPAPAGAEATRSDHERLDDLDRELAKRDVYITELRYRLHLLEQLVATAVSEVDNGHPHMFPLVREHGTNSQASLAWLMENLQTRLIANEQYLDAHQPVQKIAVLEDRITALEKRGLPPGYRRGPIRITPYVEEETSTSTPSATPVLDALKSTELGRTRLADLDLETGWGERGERSERGAGEEEESK